MKALVLLSGGIDSTTCLALAVDKYGEKEVMGLSVTYGQKHSNELEHAKSVAEWYDIQHKVIDFEPIFSGADCALLKQSKKEIPKESYVEQLRETSGKPVSTYVPFRNGLFLSAAASVAIANGCEAIYYGAHADDAAGNAYPDCSIAFNGAITSAIEHGSGEQLTVFAPLIAMTKAEVVACGTKMNAPYHLTWSCYEGGDKPCGKCGTCIDRARAFEANGIPDPAWR